MALAVALVNAGWTFNDWHQELTDPRNGAASWYRTDKNGRTRSNWTRRIERDWGKAEAFVNRSAGIESRTEATHQIGLHREQAASLPWPGRAGPTDRAVLTALHQIATARGSLRFAASVRDVATASGVSRTTAGRSLKRLQEAQWIRLDIAAHLGSGTAATYRLTSKPGREANGFIVPARADTGSDVWRGMGRTAAHIYDALSLVPMSIGDLVQATGRCAKTVGRHLSVLASQGLAQEAWPGAWTLSSADEDQIVESNNWRGNRQRQVEQHERERQAHRFLQEAHRRELQYAHTASWVAGADPKLADATPAKRGKGYR